MQIISLIEGKFLWAIHNSACKDSQSLDDKKELCSKKVEFINCLTLHLAQPTQSNMTRKVNKTASKNGGSESVMTQQIFFKKRFVIASMSSKATS